jgi:N-acetylglutamate synthase-like GNAT family acetyltransferase
VSTGARVRSMAEGDLDEADRVTRLAFGTYRGLPDPASTFGDAEMVRTRFRAAPDHAWVAEDGGQIVGCVFAARWGSFGYFGPLAVHPDWWDRGVGSRLLEPVLDAFERWELRQSGLFTFPSSPKHLGLYQKHGFWPRFLTCVLAKPVAPTTAGYELVSQASASDLSRVRALTGAVFPGLDLEREIVAVHVQGLGDTVLLEADGELTAMAVCHCGAGSEAGSDTCYVKFGAVRPGPDAAARFELLLDACDAFAAGSGAERLVAGVNTGRLDAYRVLVERGFRPDLIGVSMLSRPDEPAFDTPDDYVLDDLR